MSKKCCHTEYLNPEKHTSMRAGDWSLLSMQTTRRQYFGDNDEFCREVRYVTYLNTEKLCLCPQKHLHKKLMREMQHNLKFVRAKINNDDSNKYTPNEKRL